jgi:hypothetical protein
VKYKAAISGTYKPSCITHKQDSQFCFLNYIFGDQVPYEISFSPNSNYKKLYYSLGCTVLKTSSLHAQSAVHGSMTKEINIHQDENESSNFAVLRPRK